MSIVTLSDGTILGDPPVTNPTEYPYTYRKDPRLMTEFKKIMESLDYATEMLKEVSEGADGETAKHEIQLHICRLIGLKVFLELYDRKLGDTI